MFTKIWPLNFFKSIICEWKIIFPLKVSKFYWHQIQNYEKIGPVVIEIYGYVNHTRQQIIYLYCLKTIHYQFQIIQMIEKQRGKKSLIWLENETKLSDKNNLFSISFAVKTCFKWKYHFNMRLPPQAKQIFWLFVIWFKK